MTFTISIIVVVVVVVIIGNGLERLRSRTRELTKIKRLCDSQQEIIFSLGHNNKVPDSVRLPTSSWSQQGRILPHFRTHYSSPPGPYREYSIYGLVDFQGHT